MLGRPKLTYASTGHRGNGRCRSSRRCANQCWRPPCQRGQDCELRSRGMSATNAPLAIGQTQVSECTSDVCNCIEINVSMNRYSLALRKHEPKPCWDRVECDLDRSRRTLREQGCAMYMACGASEKIQLRHLTFVVQCVTAFKKRGLSLLLSCDSGATRCDSTQVYIQCIVLF
jgi:hypothetical protein